MPKKIKHKLGTSGSEWETRKRLLAMAKARGYYEDLKQKLDYWDGKMSNCTNEKELKDMQELAIVDIFSLYDARTGLSIDGQTVIPGEEQIKKK